MPPTELEPGRFFSESFLERSATYQRFLEIEGVLAIVVLLVVLAAYARVGPRLTRESAAGRVGTGMLLGMLGFAVVWLAQVPFGLLALWWQRRYDVAHQGYLEWLVNSFLGLGGTFVFVSVALAVAMGLAGVLRGWWWTVAAPAFVALALLFTFVSPYTIPDTAQLRDRQLVADARALERQAGLTETRLIVQDVNRFTDAPNAGAAGFGPTSTVILWDTLLDDRFSRAEVRAVLAHEFAHLAHDDTLKAVGWLALFLLPATALVAYFTRSRGGLAQPEAVPLALFVLVVLQLIATPAFNFASRQLEEAADRAALDATRNPDAERSLLRRLATTSLTDPDPPAWSQALFAQHPTIMERIALSYEWEDRGAIRSEAGEQQVGIGDQGRGDDQ